MIYIIAGIICIVAAFYILGGVVNAKDLDDEKDEL